VSSTQSAAFFFSPLFPFPSSFRSWCDSALEAPAEPTALREWITSLMLPRAVHADAECGTVAVNTTFWPAVTKGALSLGQLDWRWSLWPE